MHVIAKLIYLGFTILIHIAQRQNFEILKNILSLKRSKNLQTPLKHFARKLSLVAMRVYFISIFAHIMVGLYMTALYLHI